jgi:hypothetical protein
MKNKSDSNYLLVKLERNKIKSNLHQNTNFPLGEDFYSIDSEEKEINPMDILKFKVSKQIN